MNLDGFWDFAFAEDDNKLPNSYDSVAPVPGCFDTLPDLHEKRGTAFYRKFINLQKDRNYRLIIGGASHNAKVYLNKKLLAEHHGGFTAFNVDLPEVTEQANELIISADNRFDDLNRSLHMSHFDWYSYGGIIRPVELKMWRQVIIERIIPTVNDWRTGKIILQTEYHIAADTLSELPIEIFIDDKKVLTENVKTADKLARFELTVPDARPWSPESPHLHKLTVRLGDDIKTINLGLRQIRTEGHTVLLNDEPIRLKGINRHEIHPQFGFALPEHLLLTDAQLIKQLGCNFVRTSHYPPDSRFIDICDQLGLMVWCEATGWQYNEQMLTDKRLINAQQQCITEMIGQYAHHPSIICWGLLNECASNVKAARPTYEKLTGLIRQLDPTRPITYASDRVLADGKARDNAGGDIMFDLADWISLNVYPGWYFGDINNCTELMDSLAESVRKSGLDKKPVIISEIGAGALPGFEHYKPIKWSLSYQAELLERLISHIHKNSIFTGVCTWQFCDIRASQCRWTDRPRGYNNKGILDEYRRAKPAFSTIKKLYHKPW